MARHHLVWRWLIDCAKAETGRFFLWVPVFFATGIGLYFSLSNEPALWQSAAPIGATLAAGLFGMRHNRFFLTLAFVVLGFFTANLRTHIVAAPIWERTDYAVSVEGTLISVEEQHTKSRRLLLRPTKMAPLYDDQPSIASIPAIIRVSWRGAWADISPGEQITMRAVLSPPPPPVAPGAYDFARHLYFQRIGAVGYGISVPEVIALPTTQETLSAKLQQRIERSRTSLASHIVASAPGEAGPIIAAIVTGKRGFISPESETALRDSGLAHLLAISGLHMGLASSLVFVIVRMLLACSSHLALHHPIKKYAAIAAILSAFGYLLISGGSWSAQRAFMMYTIFFIAIIADRRALSLRNVAIAAMVILIVTPEALLHPGFQMSFAAVTGIIAAYEWSRSRYPIIPDGSILTKVRHYFIAVGVTDLIAATATAPYALYHFHRTALYSLAANLVATPLMAFWVMPFAVIALVAMPFGLDAPLWRLSAFGMEKILAVGASVAAQPGSVLLIPNWPNSALVLTTLGMLWLCLQRSSWRVLGGDRIIAGSFSIPPSSAARYLYQS